MSIHEYFADIAEELNRQSNSIRKRFASHRPSAGRNREKLVADFLRAYLPKAYGIDTGLILASTGEFSNQADIVIFDATYGAPLFPDASEKLWLIESVYAMIEVKTDLSQRRSKTPSRSVENSRIFLAISILTRRFQKQRTLYLFCGHLPALNPKRHFAIFVIFLKMSQ